MTLTEFLLARIAADETRANFALSSWVLKGPYADHLDYQQEWRS